MRHSTGHAKGSNDPMLLTIGSMTPSAIAAHFKSSRQPGSKHLHILTACGILQQQQQGREIHYHLNAAMMQEIEKWLAAFREMLAQCFDQLDNVLDQLKMN